MRVGLRLTVCGILVFTVVVAFSAYAQIPDGVSPGAVDHIAAIEGRCPQFSWGAVPGAEKYELIGYRLPEGIAPGDFDLSQADEVLYTVIPGTATSWAPNLSHCLTPGNSFVWFVRALFRDDWGEMVEVGDWSYGRFFSISPMPSAGELEEALSVLRRYSAHAHEGAVTVDLHERGTEGHSTERPAPSRLHAVPSVGGKSVTSAKTAIKGTLSDATGETYGVVGISNSTEGAGIGAAGADGGPDLVLDGSVDGEVDAVLTQEAIDRPSDSDQWFYLRNSDPTHVLGLNVEGTVVGDGSGLTAVNADTLDGTNGSDYATDAEVATQMSIHASSSDHSGTYFSKKELSTSGLGAAVHWDNLTTVPSELADGDDDTTYTAGLGLQLNGTQFSAKGPDFTPRDNTLTTVDSSVDVGQYTSITIGADGLPVISYFDVNNGDLKVAHCSDLLCATATTDTVTNGGQYTSITVGADGLPVISLQGSGAVHCSDPLCAATTTGVLTGDHTSITIGADGLPVISYYESSHLKVAHCSDLACASATLTTVDSGHARGQYTSITIGADGLPVISYYDASVLSRLMMAHCADLACTSATLVTVDSSGDVGRYTSITIGADGLPVISYFDVNNGDLKVAHCSDLLCASATLTTVDSGVDVGQYTSITIGADSLPVVSYYDKTNGDLKVAHCSDLLCASATLTTVDSGVDVGQYTSITIGADGLPVISYFDVNNGDLKVVHCANEFCVPYARRR